MDEQGDPIFFCEWLKRRRKALDLTQSELAERVGCSVGALRKIESGDRRPSKQLAELLARALEIPHEDRPTFIRIARGDLNLERLPQLSPKIYPGLPEHRSTQEAVPVPSTKHIPTQTTPLIGRESELAALEKIFKDPQCRLLTLTGIGGIGKTRLAVEFATRKSPSLPGGVFYIPLTSVNSTEKIVPAIADVLDFGFSGPTNPKEQLFNYLASHIQQEALFVLDNLEHLLAQNPSQENETGLVELISEVLQRLPNVKILGTSRERLNLHGEWTYEVYGLSVPPKDFWGRLEDYNAVTLFTKSAQRVRPDFQATANEEVWLVRICQMVDGVPLAIELAAAWVGFLSCREIAQEIQANMDFLTTSMRGIPERHRSIRATFEHSWKLLSEEERIALCRLSVFQGGFDRYGASQIAGASLPLLASLSDKSLVRRTESGRYDLHEVIRQYALAHLKEHPYYAETLACFSDYYLKWIQELEEPLKSALQQEAMRQLTVEIDNVRAAWSWAIQNNQYDLLGLAGRAFGWYYEISGLYREGVEQFEPLAQALRTGVENGRWDRVLGLALIHQALLYFRKGEFDNARKLYEESISILRPIGDHALLADAFTFVGIIYQMRGEYAKAMTSMEEGLLLARKTHERWFEALAIYVSGYVTSLMGQYEEGYERLMEGLEIFRSIGDPQAISLVLNFLVQTLIQLHRYEEAKGCMLESIQLCEKSKNRWGEGTAYRFLGLANLAEGNYTEAQTHLHKSLEIFSEYFVGWDIARTLTYLGDATAMAGNHEQARDHYLKALRLALDIDGIPVAMDAISGLGDLQAQDGKIEYALMLSYFVLKNPCSEEETRGKAARKISVLEPQLTPKQIESANLTAQANTLDSIVTGILQTA